MDRSLAERKGQEHVQRRSKTAKTASLSLQDIISVAEEAMERSGNAGKAIEVPIGHEDDPVYQAEIEPLRAWVRGLVGRWIYFFASDYQLNQVGGAQAFTDGTSIVVRPMTTEMTILHEVAHVINRTNEGQGHDKAFARTLRDLYAKHISQEAADVFWGIVGLYVDEPKMAALMGRKVWWRFHPIDREFMPETASSVEIHNWMGSPPQRGFSAMRNPWHLFIYAANLGWGNEQSGVHGIWNTDVIGFTGEIIGKGGDREPLIMPDMKVVLRYTWDQYIDELLDTPFPKGPYSHYPEDPGEGRWEKLAKDLIDSEGDTWTRNDHMAPVVLHIIDKFAPVAKVAKTATLFDKSQMASWESTKPWTLTEQEAQEQSVPGFWFIRNRGTELASWDGRYIRLCPEFFTYPESVRRVVAYHEAGHAMIDAGGGLGTWPGDPFEVMQWPGASTLAVSSGNPEEIIAEAYSVLWDDPSWFDQHGALKILGLVVSIAHKTGFPLPRGV